MIELYSIDKINVVVSLFKKLNGFSPSFILLGKKEFEETKYFTYIGAKGDGYFLVKEMFKCEIIQVESESFLWVK